jgi:hypothetical protein
MSRAIIGFTMSLDGFINDQNGSVERLYPDLDTLRYAKPLQESIEKTGALVTGRKTFAMGDPNSHAENYECRSRYSWRAKRFEQGLARAEHCWKKQRPLDNAKGFFQPTTQPTECFVLYDLRGVLQSPRVL